jgi:hypothetical protein
MPLAGPRYSERPPEVRERLEKVKARLTENAREEYQLGYVAAVGIAEQLQHHQLERLARQNFDVLRWLREYTDHVRELALEAEPPGPPDDERMTQRMLVLVGAASPEAGVETKFPWLARAAEVIGDAANAPKIEEWSFIAPGARIRGFTDALRDIWNDVESPDPF